MSGGGGGLLTVTETPADVVCLPDASRATAVMHVGAVGGARACSTTGVGRRRIRGAEVGAVQQELHARDADVVCRGGLNRDGAEDGARPAAR